MKGKCLGPRTSDWAKANTYKITKQSQFSTWLTDQMATGFQHITNSNDNIIKAVRSEAQALLTISHTLFNQTRTIERDLACRSYAQDLFTATRQEILDLRLHKTPRHVLNDLIEVLDLHRWFSSEKNEKCKVFRIIIHYYDVYWKRMYWLHWIFCHFSFNPPRSSLSKFH